MTNVITTQSTSPNPKTATPPVTETHLVNNLIPGQLNVILRNQTITLFDENKIHMAIAKAFIAVEGEIAAHSDRIRQAITQTTQAVKATFMRRLHNSNIVHIEEIQDQVETELMKAGEYHVAKAYVIYRDRHRRFREQTDPISPIETPFTLEVTGQDGRTQPLNMHLLHARVQTACHNIEQVSPVPIIEATQCNLFDKVPLKEVHTMLILSARTLIEKEPNYTYVAARLLLQTLYEEAYDFLQLKLSEKATSTTHTEEKPFYKIYFNQYIQHAIQLELLDPRLNSFDIERLSDAIDPERDQQFTYLGLQTLYDRYFIQYQGQRFELPQAFFMRVAMGLVLTETHKEEYAIAFYHLLSSFEFMSSTPTLFNSGTRRPQLASCYLTTVPDHLEGIYDAIKDNALLSKYAGGLGNDWTNVRATGSYIKGTNGQSQGIIPFLNVANATAIAVNQGGKRKGAVCAYLETWHKDIEEFLELRKNTGDERRRTHDMNTANWIPDLFMQRVAENKPWTLFSPDEVPDLHHFYGKAFETAYLAYEQQAHCGALKSAKQISALSLWRKMLSMLFETGHPWITFKDACNLRSPQQHVGIIHSSNLCTEITLNTAQDEIAVCNLGSINLAAHLSQGKINQNKLRQTVRIALRLLDNVIDINYYSVPQTRQSNLTHRPIGLGIMGFQDVLYQLNIPYASKEALSFADQSMELISYYAIEASSDLAVLRGAYPSYSGSLWSQGVLPIDSLALLAQHRPKSYLTLNTTQTLDWATLRQTVLAQGMRHSNLLAIAPTATISNICGVSPSIEPTYRNLFVKSNLSGEFTIINAYLVHALKAAGLWDEVMLNDLKYYNGSIATISRIPAYLKEIYATAFEIDPTWLIQAAARRQKWIDQSQSLNLYISTPSGKKLDQLYRLAWQLGLKTTYYLRSVSATQTEKVTIEDRSLNAVSSHAPPDPNTINCSIIDPTCDACQ